MASNESPVLVPGRFHTSYIGAPHRLRAAVLGLVIACLAIGLQLLVIGQAGVPTLVGGPIAIMLAGSIVLELQLNSRIALNGDGVVVHWVFSRKVFPYGELTALFLAGTSLKIVDHKGNSLLVRVPWWQKQSGMLQGMARELEQHVRIKRDSLQKNS